MKEALVQRGVFTSALMRKPVLPLDQEEKDWITQGLKGSTAGDVSAEVAKFKKEEALVR
jgi:4-hydroxy-tetrahydrodipicolinate synthase